MVGVVVDELGGASPGVVVGEVAAPAAGGSVVVVGCGGAAPARPGMATRATRASAATAAGSASAARTDRAGRTAHTPTMDLRMPTASGASAASA